MNNTIKMLKNGGVWLREMREFIQWNSQNGSDVIWGSNDYVGLRNITVRQLEELAARIAIRAVEQYEQELAKHDTRQTRIRKESKANSQA